VPDARSVGLVALRVAVAVLAVAGVGAVAHLPLGEAPVAGALRVALRTSLGQVEVCRDRSEEELAAFAAHMRQRRICEITTVDYRLRVLLDGRELLDRAVVHHGVRHNRPLVVDALLPVTPGEHRIEVRFEPTASTVDGAGELPHALYEGVVDFASGRIRLLTLDAGAAAWSLAG
jgi:hypothetical protein